MGNLGRPKRDARNNNCPRSPRCRLISRAVIDALLNLTQQFSTQQDVAAGFLIVAYFVTAIWAADIAQRQGRRPWLWVMLCLLTFPAGFFFLLEIRDGL